MEVRLKDFPAHPAGMGLCLWVGMGMGVKTTGFRSLPWMADRGGEPGG